VVWSNTAEGAYLSSGEAEKAAGAFDSEPPIQLPRPVSPHAGLVFAAAHESGIDPTRTFHTAARGHCCTEAEDVPVGKVITSVPVVISVLPLGQK
jgi:hypothetical protein